MTSYIQSIIIVGVASSLALSALPKNESQSAKYVKYLASFLMLAVLLTPLQGIYSAFGGLKEAVSTYTEENYTEENKNYDDPIVEKSTETIAKYILSVCKSEFGVNTENARVKVILDDGNKENIIINEVQIFIREMDQVLLNDIEAHFSKMFDTKVFVFGF